MRLATTLRFGFNEIMAYKVRSFLSFFAIAIGIATFFYTLTSISRAYNDMDKTREVSGAGRFSVTVKKELPVSFYEELKRSFPQIKIDFVGEWLFPFSSYDKTTRLKGIHAKPVTPVFTQYDFPYRLEGRFINWDDIKYKRNVAVLIKFPHEKKERNFWGYAGDDDDAVDFKKYIEKRSLLNRDIFLEGLSFRIIGVLHVPPAQRDYRMDSNEDANMLIPYGVNIYKRSWEADTEIIVLTGREGNAPQYMRRVGSYIKGRYGKESIIQEMLFYDRIKRELSRRIAATKAMLFLGLMAMIAGGIGIMNVSIAIIYARTKEIGIRRAIGATKGDIMIQFLCEAMLLGFLGGIAGIILGAAALVYTVGESGSLYVGWWVVPASLFIALATSFFFALYPAFKAANLKPVDALKYE